MENTDSSDEERDLDDGVPCGVELRVLLGREREVPGAKVVVGDVAVVSSDELLLASRRADLRSHTHTHIKT